MAACVSCESEEGESRILVNIHARELELEESTPVDVEICPDCWSWICGVIDPDGELAICETKKSVAVSD